MAVENSSLSQSHRNEKRKKNTSMLCVCGITFEKYAERVSLRYAMFHWGDRFSLLEKLSRENSQEEEEDRAAYMHVVALRKIFYYNIIVFLIVVITLQLLLISLHRIFTTRICHSFSPELKYTSSSVLCSTTDESLCRMHNPGPALSAFSFYVISPLSSARYQNHKLYQRNGEFYKVEFLSNLIR